MIQGCKEKIFYELDHYLPLSSTSCKVGIKINLQSPPKLNAPRTDAIFLTEVISFLIQRGHKITILEGANGHLRDNLEYVGLGHLLSSNQVSVIDTDLERDVGSYERNKRIYAIPNVLNELDVRLALPCATKRSGYLFSCNVKTFVGLLPRSYCVSKKDELSFFSRPLIHEDLTTTVADIFSLFAINVPFFGFLNGGNTFSEFSPIQRLPEYYFSRDAVALDFKISECLNVSPPPYLMRLKNELGMCEK